MDSAEQGLRWQGPWAPQVGLPGRLLAIQLGSSGRPAAAGAADSSAGEHKALRASEGPSKVVACKQGPGTNPGGVLCPAPWEGQAEREETDREGPGWCSRRPVPWSVLVSVVGGRAGAAVPCPHLTPTTLPGKGIWHQGQKGRWSIT